METIIGFFLGSLAVTLWFHGLPHTWGYQTWITMGALTLIGGPTVLLTRWMLF